MRSSAARSRPWERQAFRIVLWAMPTSQGRASSLAVS